MLSSKLAAILNLKVKNSLKHKINIRFGFLDPENAKINILDLSVGQITQKLIFNMADGSHLKFESLTHSAHPFVRSMGAIFFHLCHKDVKSTFKPFYAFHGHSLELNDPTM